VFAPSYPPTASELVFAEHHEGNAIIVLAGVELWEASSLSLGRGKTTLWISLLAVGTRVVSGRNRSDQRFHSDDVHNPCQILGQELGSDLRKRFGEEWLSASVQLRRQRQRTPQRPQTSSADLPASARPPRNHAHGRRRPFARRLSAVPVFPKTPLISIESVSAAPIEPVVDPDRRHLNVILSGVESVPSKNWEGSRNSEGSAAQTEIVILGPH
jgi:hypothetical protein